jgi:uncharacterized protein YyaL (SSP411 family)
MRCALVAFVAAAVLAAQESAPTSRPAENRLAREKSPYLRQHATNPVDWYPWGEEAFERARRENKPIFFSSGYASCHWCHVMARESFENAEIAAYLNAHFVCVKLDREERPDVDRIYLEACLLLTGSGGWPLTAFLAPDRRPFYLATYLPPDDRDGVPGFLSIAKGAERVWREKGADVVEAAASFAEGFALRHLPTPAVEKLLADLERRAFAAVLAASSRPAAESRAEDAEPTAADEEADAWRARVVRAREELDRRRAASRPADLLVRTAARLNALEDVDIGGIGLQPKFPAVPNLFALLRASARSGAPEGRVQVERQLRAMLNGGIRDRLAGGWHRYAVDRRWETPHFEKMLYDQALMAQALLEAWQISGDAAYARAARETLDFCLRDLALQDGGFAAALDAESPGGEGAYYVWTRAELRQALSGEKYAALALWAGFEADGVKEDDAATLCERTPLADVAGILKTDAATAAARVDAACADLAAVRAKRPPPRRVDAAIAGWNALLVSALARAGGAWEDARYLKAAVELQGFLDAKLRGKDGLYLRRRAGGESAHRGDLSDQSFALLALLDLHEATLDPTWRARAAELASAIVATFGSEDGGLYDSVADDLPWRTRETTDEATPSAAGAAALGFARLALSTENAADRARAERLLAFLEPRGADSPADHPTTSVAADLLRGKAARAEFHGEASVGRMMAAGLRVGYRPFVVLTTAARNEPVERPFATVCVGTTCLEPAFDVRSLAARADSAVK